MDRMPRRKSSTGVQPPEANSVCHGCRGVFCGSAGRCQPGSRSAPKIPRELLDKEKIFVELAPHIPLTKMRKEAK